MIAAEHTQSLTDFRETAAATLERLNSTGEAEVITVDGQARAVLLAPDVYHEMARQLLLARDVGTIRRSMTDIEEGKVSEAGTYFDGLREKLLAMKAAHAKGSTA